MACRLAVRCVCSKLDSAIMMMKSAEGWRSYDAAHVLDGAMDRSVLVESRSKPIVRTTNKSMAAISGA
jgi:hypothetical protein